MLVVRRHEPVFVRARDSGRRRQTALEKGGGVFGGLCLPRRHRLYRVGAFGDRRAGGGGGKDHAPFIRVEAGEVFYLRELSRHRDHADFRLLSVAYGERKIVRETQKRRKAFHTRRGVCLRKMGIARDCGTRLSASGRTGRSLFIGRCF